MSVSFTKNIVDATATSGGWQSIQFWNGGEKVSINDPSKDPFTANGVNDILAYTNGTNFIIFKADQDGNYQNGETVKVTGPFFDPVTQKQMVTTKGSNSSLSINWHQSATA